MGLPPRPVWEAGTSQVGPPFRQCRSILESYWSLRPFPCIRPYFEGEVKQMLTPRRWSNFLFAAIALGIAAGGVIAFVGAYVFRDHQNQTFVSDPTNAALPVLPAANERR